MKADVISTHPIANVLQSVAGAIAVMGSYIVRVEMCSDVEGSKSVTDPWAFPVVCVSYYRSIQEAMNITKSDISVPHEGCHIDGFISGEAGDFTAGENVPSHTSVASIIAYCKPACAALTRIVHDYPPHIFMVSLEPSFNC